MAAGAAGAAGLEFDEYVTRAHAAKSRGDWQSAASQFAQAINHPELPKDGAIRSLVYLEYGHAIGVLCQFDEAKIYLLRGKEMAERAGSSTFRALYELATLSVAQNKFSDAVSYFSQLAPLIERDSQARVSPQMVADAQEKFAIALAATGRSDEADARQREAVRIRETSPGATKGIIVPYGAKCPKP